MGGILSSRELGALAASQPPLESFGPQSERPYLAFAVEGADPKLAAWLRGLPCPVIGLGRGSVQTACDVLIAADAELEALARNISAAPIASMVLVQHLRASAGLSLDDTLMAESFAYATLQQGPEFRAWQAENAALPAVSPPEAPLLIERGEDTLRLTLDDPDNRNAIGIAMRNALCEALDMALADPGVARVELTGKGRIFSTGGQVAEFGSVSDPATAHWIRTLRLPACRLARLRERLHVHVNGAAIGAGAEMAAFGAYVTASGDAWFQLPELRYGLIPGAGGTASLTHRIGRQATAWLALSMKRIDAQAALELGLVDEVRS